MKIDKQQINNLFLFVKKQWKPFSLGGLILVILIATLTIPGGGKNVSEINSGELNNTGNGTNNSPSPTKKPFNPLGFLFDQDKKNTSNQSASITPPTVPLNVITAETSTSTVTKINPNGTKSTQTVTGGTTTQTTQGIINPTTNIANDIGSNTEPDNIRIVFQNPDGTTTTYIPPGTPPDEVRWARYTNTQEKYAINYPYNWQFVYSLDNGHEGVALYPPSANPNDPSAPYIGFGVTDTFLLPVLGDMQSSYTTQITVDGVPGTLYTNGSLGNSYIASVMQYSGKYFGLGASKSDATFAYVYYYMLNSLTFNVE